MNIVRTVNNSPADLSAYWCHCGAAPIGMVNSAHPFCVEHQSEVILARYDALVALNLPDFPITVKINPTPASPYELTDQQARLAARAENLARTIKEAGEELESLKAQLRELGAGDFTHQGRRILAVGASVPKFNAAYAATVLTPEELAEVTEVVVSGDAVKKKLGEERYNACRKDSGGKQSVSFPGVK